MRDTSKTNCRSKRMGRVTGSQNWLATARKL